MEFLFAGAERTELAKFAKKYARSYLKTDMQVLNKSTFPKLQSKMSEKTAILISEGFTLGADQGTLLKTIQDKNVTLLFKDSKKEGFRGYAAVTPEAPFVVIHNAAKGRKQQVIIIDNAPPVQEGQIQSIESDTEENVAAAAAVFSPQEMAMPPEDSISDQPVSVARLKFDPDATLKVMTSWLTDDRFQIMNQSRTLTDETHYWEHYTTLILDNVDAYPSYEGEPSWTGTTRCQTFCAVTIVMYATKQPRKKWIKFQLTDAVGMKVTMANDQNSRRGHFNQKAKVYIYPGEGHDLHDSQLPPGWTRPYFEPRTPNSETMYISTTGWSVGVTGGGDANGPKAEVTASYSQSEQVRRNIYDFSVRNLSDHSMSGWEFYYTAVDGDWAKHTYYKAGWGWAISGIADLAKSTMTINTEAVYEGPADTNMILPWCVNWAGYHMLLSSQGSVFHKNLHMYPAQWTRGAQIHLDMSVVTNPDV